MATEPNEEVAEIIPRTRCCFCIPRFGSDRSPAVGLQWWRRMRAAENEDGWWARGINALKQIREWSEIVAGPRWKTFIRRLNRSKSGGGRHGGRFQYDPLSYALNFDDLGQNGNFDEDLGFRNFSTRFATIPTPAKSSMEVEKNAPAIA